MQKWEGEAKGKECPKHQREQDPHLPGVPGKTVGRGNLAAETARHTQHSRGNSRR